ncbi:MAG: OmpA family protein [Gammaproteobacteria bacterium]|nr:OmpA family protein [Gammaproteobacteria bacterium]
MFRVFRVLGVSIMVGYGITATAAFRTYLADIEDSVWEFDGNPVKCELKHKIPLYGEAVFSSKAGRAPNMIFVLDSMRNRVPSDRLVEVRALASHWQPGLRAEQLLPTHSIPGEKTLNIIDEQAWKLLVGLERGMNPAFYYRDFSDNSDRVAVALSPVNFQAVYDQFLSCVEGLLPYDFREIQYTMVHFDFDKHNLSRDDKQKLDVLADFIKYDPEIEVVLLEGHTDSIALRSYNKKLGMKRADAVKTYLTDKGVMEQKIRAVSYGERRPLESNATEEGRAMNRRVFVTLNK